MDKIDSYRKGSIMKNFLIKCSILFKIFLIYTIFYFSAGYFNTYILNNINSFYTPFANQKKLIYYAESPQLSLSAHRINKYRHEPGFNIVIVGDSKVEDMYVRYGDSIAGQLESLLFGNSEMPHIFNFGTSGMKLIYAYERIKKAVSYKPDLIVLAIGAGNLTDVNWVFGPVGNYYDISLGGGVAGAYANLIKLNDQNAPFISENLRCGIVPTYMLKPFFEEYINAMKAKKKGYEMRDPGEALVHVQLGDIKLNYFLDKYPFYIEKKHFEVIGQIAKLVSNADIKLIIYVPPVNQKMNSILYEPGYYDKLVEAIKAQTEDYGVPVIDLSDAVPDEYFLDGGHVKDQGDKIVAQKLADYIKQHYLR